MSAAAPGWQPDPTGRHEYRFWNGTRWTDDVADRGTASVDPLHPTPTQPGTQPQPGQPTSPSGPGTPGPEAPGQSPWGARGPESYGRPSGLTPQSSQMGRPGAYQPGAESPAPPRPERPAGPGDGGGRSTALLVALGALVLCLAGGILFILLGRDDDGGEQADDTDTTTTTEATTTTSTPSTTVPDETSEQVIEEFATAIFEGSNGDFTLDQARCMATGILDVIGLGRLAEVRIEAGDDATVNPVDLLTEAEQEAAFDVMRTCVPAGTGEAAIPD